MRLLAERMISTQVARRFVERFFGSSLPPGTISHLNYAQKVAQMPMLVAGVGYWVLAAGLSVVGGRLDRICPALA